MGVHLLFVCYSGDHPQYLDALYGPQLQRIAGLGFPVTVLSFEGAGQTAVRDRIARRFEESGIQWFTLPYHRRIEGKVLDILSGALWTTRWALGRRQCVLHARSHVAGAMALLPSLVLRVPFIFDIDGSLPDEYVDAGRWRRGGVLHRLGRILEALMLRVARVTIVHTEAQRARLAGHARAVRLVRHGIDLAPLAAAREQAALWRMDRTVGRVTLVHTGNVDPRIYRARELARFVRHFRSLEPRGHLLVLAVAGTDETSLRDALRAGGLDDAHATILVDAPPDTRAAATASAFAGLSFRDLPSTAYAISPVKVAEYLGSGIPVVTHEGIGDARRLIGDNRVGIVLHDLADDTMRQGAAELLSLRRDSNLSDRCVRAATAEFDLERTVHELIRLYLA